MRRIAFVFTAIAVAGLAVIPAIPVRAEEACFVPYEDFERDVPHIDMEHCLGDMATNDDVFCRLSLQGDHVLIYTFRYGDRDSCLEDVESFDFNEFKAKYGVTYTLD